MDSNGPRPGAGNVNRQRINEMIRVPQILVIAETGENLGVMATQDALARARSVDLDLVEVQPQKRFQTAIEAADQRNSTPTEDGRSRR